MATILVSEFLKRGFAEQAAIGQRDQQFRDWIVGPCSVCGESTHSVVTSNGKAAFLCVDCGKAIREARA